MTFDAPEPQTDITPESKVIATLTTSCGDIVIELDPASSPETVSSFVFLARQGYYDGQVFHRIAKGFVIQGGDPNANGSGGPGYIVPDEFPDDDFVYEVGVVAMANRGAGSTGSQFFIVIGEDARFLTNTFNVLGRVISGQETLDRITEVPTRASPGSVEESLPLESVYIESVTIEVTNS
jgi:cyclophilin family peptidyl-prolyl cis-trans isomerase